MKVPEVTGIRAILFDADGVLIFPWRFSNYLRREHGITPQMTAEFFHGPFNDCLLGRADLKTLLASTLPGWGWAKSVGELVKIWLEIEDAPDARLLKVIRSLRQAGYLCCVASSQERNRADYMRNEMGFGEAFDRLFFSCDLGCQKPDELFYRSVEESLCLVGSQLLFWDDNEKNVEAARGCGWQAEVYTGFEEFSEKIKSLLEYI